MRPIVPMDEKSTPLDLPLLFKPSLLGAIDCHGIEMIYPVRRGRNPDYIGASSPLPRPPEIVGAPWCVALNHLVQIIDGAELDRQTV